MLGARPAEGTRPDEVSRFRECFDWSRFTVLCSRIWFRVLGLRFGVLCSGISVRPMLFEGPVLDVDVAAAAFVKGIELLGNRHLVSATTQRVTNMKP